MSVTALAEYADMLFTRAHLVLGLRNWWLEMRPNTTDVDPQGYVALRARVNGPPPVCQPRIIEHMALMNAIEQNATVPSDVLETVVEHHLRQFAEAIKKAETVEDQEWNESALAQ